MINGSPPLKGQQAIERQHRTKYLHNTWGKWEEDPFILISEHIGRLLWEQSKWHKPPPSPDTQHKHRDTCRRLHHTDICYLTCWHCAMHMCSFEDWLTSSLLTLVSGQIMLMLHEYALPSGCTHEKLGHPSQHQHHVCCTPARVTFLYTMPPATVTQYWDVSLRNNGSVQIFLTLPPCP